MKEQADALLSAMTEHGCEGARAGMAAVVESIRSPLDGPSTRRLLDTLRSHRCFAPMKTFSNASWMP
jgi:hypothetical protein